MAQQKVDLFGDKVNQGQSYDKFRPVYPEQFINQIKYSCQNLDNYLDFATGTGQLLFKVAPYVKKQIVGNDISETQIEVARKKVQEYEQNQTFKSKIDLVHGDFSLIKQQLKEKNLPEKFEIVSIAQALHWLDVDKFCQIVKEDLLAENGKLFVLGYFALGYEYTFQNVPKEINQKGILQFGKFYDIVGKYFECDQNELSQGYPNYPFTKYFKNAKRIEITESIRTDVSGFINYCKTFSAYNTYLRKFNKQKDFVDPAQKLEQDIQEELKELQNQFNQYQNLIDMKNYYFIWELSN